MGPFRFLRLGFLALFVAACSTQAASTPIPAEPSLLPSSTSAVRPGAAVPTSQPPVVPTISETPDLPQTVSCGDWQSWPVIPAVSETARELYQRGQAGGNNPRSFSKIGDGEIAAQWFFTAFDLGQGYYDLGPHQGLVPAIEHFDGSFGRLGMAARRGFNTERILDPSASDRKSCEEDESPLACELRLHRPAFAILSLGTNQAWEPEEFERGLRQILELLLSENIVPILSTKGDNLEGDHRINRTIACLAEEYEVPLWNFWAAIQPLPNHGLQPDLEHLTYYGTTDFDDDDAMQSAWTVRNLTALQALDAVWRGVTAEP